LSQDIDTKNALNGNSPSKEENEIDVDPQNTLDQVLADCLSKISESRDADMFLYSAPIDEDKVDKFLGIVKEKTRKRKNVILVFTTFGGSPHAAYRLARTLKRLYDNFTLFLFGSCKSAGTLIAIGADKIVMSDFAELGPLDMQLPKADDMVARASGLDIQEALRQLSSYAYEVFDNCFITTLARSRGTITTKTAADIAGSLANGLISPIAGQIDPLRIGEVYRSIRVAEDYGRRLNPEREEALEALVSGYSSHSFVIDYDEACKLFKDCVRQPNALEAMLGQVLFPLVRYPEESGSFIMDLGDKMHHTVPEGNNSTDGSADSDGSINQAESVEDESESTSNAEEKPNEQEFEKSE